MLFTTSSTLFTMHGNFASCSPYVIDATMMYSVGIFQNLKGVDLGGQCRHNKALHDFAKGVLGVLFFPLTGICRHVEDVKLPVGSVRRYQAVRILQLVLVVHLSVTRLVDGGVHDARRSRHVPEAVVGPEGTHKLNKGLQALVRRASFRDGVPIGVGEHGHSQHTLGGVAESQVDAVKLAVVERHSVFPPAFGHLHCVWARRRGDGCFKSHTVGPLIYLVSWICCGRCQCRIPIQGSSTQSHCRPQC
mmetsp:Transcript_46309/g.88374  ORF Transcript_46309/g.88374 Transcript_46309/m.88374 type:complete len:247 (+) Transcript_46309:229-969(+)